MRYPKEALVARFDMLNGNPRPMLIEILGRKDDVYLILVRCIDTGKHYWAMRYELDPLTSAAKVFLSQVKVRCTRG